MRRHVLIHESEHCNVFLIEWPPGTGLDWHDHGDSYATIQVLEGTLTDQRENPARYNVDGRGTPSEEQIPSEPTRHRAGQLFGVPRRRRHKIWNNGQLTVLSLHTYFPPLTVTYEPELELDNQNG